MNDRARVGDRKHPDGYQGVCVVNLAVIYSTSLGVSVHKCSSLIKVKTSLSCSVPTAG